VTSIGLAAAIIGAPAATGAVLPWLYVAAAGAGCVVLAAAVGIYHVARTHLPALVIDDENIDGTYTAKYCTKQSLAEANALTVPYYRHEYVTDNVAEGWWSKNPKGFVAIYNQSNQLCASFGIIAMEPSFLRHFTKGAIRDNNMETADLLTCDQSKRSDTLYISGVVVRDPESIQGKRRARVMVWEMLRYVVQFYGTRKKRRIFALAVNRESENILKRFKFSIQTRASNRIDKLDLYGAEISKEFFREVNNRVGDCSHMCKEEYV